MPWFINEDGEVYEYEDIEQQAMMYPGDDHTPFESEAVARAAADALEPVEPPTVPVSIEEALNLAIFSINTFVAPDASSDADCAYLESRADEAIETLVKLRDINREMKDD